MKRLTGGDPIEANLMHNNPIVFKPSHTLVMVTNHIYPTGTMRRRGGVYGSCPSTS